MKIKTIDVNAKEWFDKVYGNSYFSAVVTLNFGMPDAISFKLPFQYGYGDHYVQMAEEEMVKRGFIEKPDKTFSWWCRDNGIILRYSKQTGCKKREL